MTAGETSPSSFLRGTQYIMTASEFPRRRAGSGRGGPPRPCPPRRRHALRRRRARHGGTVGRGWSACREPTTPCRVRQGRLLSSVSGGPNTRSGDVILYESTFFGQTTEKWRAGPYRLSAPHPAPSTTRVPCFRVRRRSEHDQTVFELCKSE